MRLICRICTAMHSNAQQCTAMHSNAHPTTAHLRSIANSTARTRHHSTARRRTRRHSTARYGAHGTLAALGAVLPRATDAPRYGQQGMPDRTKAGPRLLSFIFLLWLFIKLPRRPGPSRPVRAQGDPNSRWRRAPPTLSRVARSCLQTGLVWLRERQSSGSPRGSRVASCQIARPATTWRASTITQVAASSR